MQEGPLRFPLNGPIKKKWLNKKKDFSTFSLIIREPDLIFNPEIIIKHQEITINSLEIISSKIIREIISWGPKVSFFNPIIIIIMHY